MSGRSGLNMYAILGASGKAGRAGIEKLRVLGAPVRAVVRESSNKTDLEALGQNPGARTGVPALRRR